MDKKNELHELFILILIGAAMLVIMKISAGNVSDSDNYIDLNGQWEVTRNTEKFTTDSLDRSSFKITQKGDTIILETVLPEYDIQAPELEFFSIHSVVDIYLDEKKIYSYGHNLYDEGKVVGYGYHYAELPAGDKERTIKIELLVTENNAFSSVQVPRICNSKVVRTDFIRQNRIVLALSCFMGVFGIIVFVVTGFVVIWRKSFFKLLCVALFSLSIGTWVFSNYNLLFIFTDNLVAKIYFEFGGLQLATLFMLLYFRDESRNGSKLRLIIFNILEVIMIAFVIINFAGQAIGNIHLPATLPYLHILMILIVVYIFGIVTSDMIKKRTSHIVLFGGIIIVLVSILADLMRYYVTKYIPAFASSEFRGLGCVGAVIFVVSMVMHCMNQLNASLIRQADEKALKKLAYTDPLTELSNRRACEEKMDKIDNEHSDYGIIEFDLNNLKYVNDSIGHANGDEYIREFGIALKKSFMEASLISRTGGDEFVVIYTDSLQMKLKENIEKLTKEIEEINKSHKGWTMSTAYGSSTFEENDGLTIRKALKIADERMYENKAKMKNAKT